MFTFAPLSALFRKAAALRLVLAILAAPCFAQQSPIAPVVPEPTATGAEQPLGTVVRNSKKDTSSKAKRVITEDNMNAMPLPPLHMDGPENGDEVVAAIADYKNSHSPDETEAAVHAWFERYDQDLAAAIQQNKTVSTLREENYSNGMEICREGGDYYSCEMRRRAEYTGIRHDQYTLSKNAALEVRVQHEFMRVRSGIARYGLRYDWFKIRTTNGIDTY